MTDAESIRLVESSQQQAKVHGTPSVSVEFRALGPVEALVGGRPVDLGAPKQRALLTLLISRIGQPLSVDVMLEELWSGRPPASAVTSLQAYVANLRRVLEPARAPRTPAKVLRTGDRGYLIDGGAAAVDVQRFEEHATAGWKAWDRGEPKEALREFESALGLWRGQAYVELPVTSQAMPEAARLEELRLSAVEGRCAALLAVGAHEVAVAELEAFVQAHPLREYGCELLSLALYRAGRQADALAVLRANQKRLAEQLGIDPRPALQNLERDILNQAPELEWRPAPAATARSGPGALAFPPWIRPAAEPPATGSELFIGREAQLRQLFEALAAASAGHGRVVTVSGELAVGKTSLLRHFTALAGTPVLWGACPEHLATPPLWPWQQVLRAAIACCHGCPVPAPVAELLDADADRPADAAAEPAATMRRFEAIVHYLLDVARSTPLVIVLDHLHRADPGSLQLLAHLAESVPTSRLLVAVSYQSGEAAAAAPSAVLARAEPTRVELTGLDVRDTQALAGAMLRREVGRPAAEALRARTEGNPFFLRELIKVAAGEGRLEQPHTAPVPVPVREVVLRRVARLPRAAADLLVVASVAGRSFPIDAVAEAASVESETALGLVEAIMAAGLVVEDPQRLGWFRFTHALTAEVLNGTVGRLRRARLLRRIDAVSGRAPEGQHQKDAMGIRHLSIEV